MTRRWLWGGLIMVFLFGGAAWAGYVLFSPPEKQELNTNVTGNVSTVLNVPVNTQNNNQTIEPVPSVLAPEVVYPMDGFLDRITKKPFGIKIVPATSPVQPERFSGYHTGVDLETTAEERDTDLPVRAIAAGAVVAARQVDGYGGVIAIQHTINGRPMIGVYGHLRSSSFTVKNGDRVTVGQLLGVLGTGGTGETDGERKHLHFGLVRGTTLTYRGYVATQSQLAGWYDPVVMLREAGAR